jgi:hypothetical protein
MSWSQDWPTGSTYTNGSGADVDIVRFTEDPVQERAALLAAGFEMCGEEDYTSPIGTPDAFFAVRKGLLNIIVVWEYLTYLRWVGFTEIAAKIGCLDKVERIALATALRTSDEQSAQNIVRTSRFNQTALWLSTTQRHLALQRY